MFLDKQLLPTPRASGCCHEVVGLDCLGRLLSVAYGVMRSVWVMLILHSHRSREGERASHAMGSELPHMVTPAMVATLLNDHKTLRNS